MPRGHWRSSCMGVPVYKWIPNACKWSPCMYLYVFCHFNISLTIELLYTHFICTCIYCIHSGYVTLRRYIAWYDFRILYLKKVYRLT